VAFSRDGRKLATYVIGPDQVPTGVGAWDAATGRPLDTFRPRDDYISNPIAFTPDGDGLAVTTTRNVVVYDLAAGRALTGGRVNEMAPDGTTVAVRTNHGPTELYDVPWRPSATGVAAAAVLLALPAAGLAWWRCRRLWRSGAATAVR
jgi:hypothetical protein